MEEYRDSLVGFIFNDLKELRKTIAELDKKVDEKFNKLNEKLEEVISMRERVEILSIEQEKICTQIVELQKEKHEEVKRTLLDDKRFRRDIWLVGLAALGSLIIQLLTFLFKK